MITGCGVLRKDDVDFLKSKIPRGIDMDKYINEIIAHFNNDDSIAIADSTELNHILQKSQGRLPHKLPRQMNPLL